MARLSAGSHAIAAAILLSFASLSALAGDVTPERLLAARAEPENWLTSHGALDGARFSDLAILDRDTVNGLVELYGVPLGGLYQGSGNFAEAVPVSPLVEDGFLYIVDGRGGLSKLDLRARGRIVWRSEAGADTLDNWLEPSRGIALWRGFVLSTSADGQVHWIDKETGALVRSAALGDPAEGYTITAAPLVVGDRVIVGGAGARRGGFGRLDALDAETGAPLWRVDMLAPADEAGGPVGGATFLQTGVYDAATGLTVWTAGPAVREPGDAVGDDGLANAAVAVDVETGAVRWHHAYVPADDANGFAEAGPHHVVSLPDGGTALGHFASDGVYHLLAGVDGAERTAVTHMPGVPDGVAGASGDFGVAWANRADCPNIRSTPDFASAYSPRTGLAYGAGADGCLTEAPPAIHTYSAPGWLGAYYAGAAADLGLLSAVDPLSGEVAAQRLFDFPLHAGALATAGGLVFTTTAEGTLHALDETTLETVWSHKFGSLAAVPPTTFSVDGRQYVAVVVSGNAFTGELSYQPPEMRISEAIFVLVILGLRS